MFGSDFRRKITIHPTCFWVQSRMGVVLTMSLAVMMIADAPKIVVYIGSLGVVGGHS